MTTTTPQPTARTTFETREAFTTALHEAREHGDLSFAYRANISGIDLSQLDLSDLDLTGCYAARTDFTGTGFSQTILDHGVFSGSTFVRFATGEGSGRECSHHRL